MKNLINSIRIARFVWIAGNGGSNSTAEHLAEDLFSKGVRAINLGSNSSLITMIGNDFGYDQTFSRQILNYAGHDDLLITISCSGTSENIVNAKMAAKAMGMNIFSFETFKGKNRDYEKLEDKHLQLVHKIKKGL